jgi:hypothetical protein
MPSWFPRMALYSAGPATLLYLTWRGREFTMWLDWWFRELPEVGLLDYKGQPFTGEPEQGNIAYVHEWEPDAKFWCGVRAFQPTDRRRR